MLSREWFIEELVLSKHNVQIRRSLIQNLVRITDDGSELSTIYYLEAGHT
jgi:hypothetical protein